MSDLPGPAFVSDHDRDRARAEQAALYADQVVQAQSLDALVEEMRARQQAEYEGRVEVASRHGRLVVYNEFVFLGKPYAWVQYEGDRLRMLKLTQDGIVLSA